MKKVALLVSYVDNSKIVGYVWETPSENTLSNDFNTRKEALANMPDSNIYVCRDCDNNWELI